MKKVYTKYRKYVYYAILFFFIAFLIFLPFFLNGKSLIWDDDGAKQHYIIFYDYLCYLKNILINGFNDNTFSWNIGLGTDIIPQYSYYVIGDIFVYIGLFFSKQCYPYLYSFLIILRMFFVGISMLYFCNYRKVNDYKSILLSLMYAFSAFILYGVVRHPFFANAAILFPLFIMAIEKYIRDNKKVFLIFISFLTIISNFYFCYKIVVLGLLYAVLLFFIDNDNKKISNFVKKLFGASFCFFIAFLISSIILIPTIHVFLNLDTGLRNSLTGFYSLAYYRNLVLAYVTTHSNIWQTIGVSPLCIMLAPLLLKKIRNPKNKLLFIYLLITTVMLFFPIFGSFMNGFSFPSNRWVFGYIFFLVLMVNNCLKDDLIFNKKELLLMSIISIFYFLLFFICRKSLGEALIELSITAIILFIFIFQSKYKTKFIAKICLLFIICFGIVFNGLYLYSESGKGYSLSFLTYDNIDNFYYNLNGNLNKLDKVIEEIEEKDSSFSRIARIPDTYHNLSILLDYKSTAGYFSLLNGSSASFSSDLNNIQNKANNVIKLFDNRTIANNVLGNKYYIIDQKYSNKVPYGYEKYLEFDYSNIIVYKNKYNLSPFIFYDSYILNDEYNKLNSLEKESSLLSDASIFKGDISLDIDYKKEYDNGVNELKCEIKNINKNDNNYIYIFSEDKIELECEGVKNSEVYLEIDNLDMYKSDDNRFTYWINVKREDYFNSKKIENKNSSAYYVDLPILLFNMGYVRKSNSTNIEVNLTSKGEYSLDDIKVYSLSMNDYKKRVNYLNKDQFEILKYEDGYIRGRINNKKNGILQLATDYSIGWNVFIDGKKVDTFVVNNAFLGIEVPKGEHEIIYEYETPFKDISRILSIVGIISYIIIIVIEVRGIEMESLLKSFKGNLKVTLQRIRRIGYIIFYIYFKNTNKVKENKILFLSDSRADLSGNFKFVYDEIMKDKNKYEVTTLLKKNLSTKKTLKEKINLCREIALSKYIFLDDFYPIIYVLKLRKETKLIQLWHAMGAYKTVGYSRAGKPGGPDSKSLTHRGYTGAIVSSESIRKNYAEAFNMDIEKVHALGIPRTDIFFDKKYEKNVKKRIYDKYPMLKNKKVIMFAPTFRGNGQMTAYYDFSWIDFKKLKKSFSKDYVCIIKLHPFIKNIPDYDFENDDFYIDLTSEREINDLLFVTDVLVTDYSSVIFEYSFFERPVVFFTPDLDDYRNSRDFYYSLDKYTYGDIAKNDDELIKCIKKGKVNKKKIEEFRDYFCSSCDGNSTKKVVDFYIRKKEKDD